jgi:hypothetical protein
MTANDIKRILGTVGVESKHMFSGIYIASVVNVNDPLGLGRVTLKIPQVLGTATSNWADPLGFIPSAVPAPGTIVHAYFTGGDVNLPIYASLNLATINAEITALQASVAALSGFPSAWQALTLTAGWSNMSGFEPAQVRISNPGVAQLVGHVQNGTTADGTLIATMPGGFMNATNDQIFAVTVIAGAGSDVQTGGLLGSSDTAGLSDGTINGSSTTTGLPDGTTQGTSGSSNATNPHTHGPGSFSVTNGQHSHGPGSYAVTNGTHSHTLSGAASQALVNYNSPIAIVDTGGGLTIFNLSPNASQISFNFTLVAS